MLVTIVLVGLLVPLISGQAGEVTISLNDGVGDVADGNTQSGKPVEITCVYSGTLKFGSAVRLNVKKTEAEDWATVADDNELESPYKNDGNYSVVFDVVTANPKATMKFTIKDVQIYDAGTYECAFKILDGTLTARKEKKVQVFAETETLTIKDTPGGNFEAKAGESREMECVATGGSRPHKMELVVGGEVYNMEITGDNELGPYTGNAIVEFSGAHDKTTISCKSYVQTFTDPKLATAALSITEGVSVTCDPKEHKAKENTPIEFKCTVTGSPKPKEGPGNLKWTMGDDGTDFSALNGRMDALGITSTGVETTDSYDITLKMTITKLTAKMYTLRAFNDHGDDHASVTVAIGESSSVVDSGDSKGGTAALTLSSLLMTIIVAFYIFE